MSDSHRSGRCHQKYYDNFMSSLRHGSPFFVLLFPECSTTVQLGKMKEKKIPLGMNFVPGGGVDSFSAAPRDVFGETQNPVCPNRREKLRCVSLSLALSLSLSEAIALRVHVSASLKGHCAGSRGRIKAKQIVFSDFPTRQNWLPDRSFVCPIFSTKFRSRRHRYIHMNRVALGQFLTVFDHLLFVFALATSGVQRKGNYSL
jgi:hypothetical protein